MVNGSGKLKNQANLRYGEWLVQQGVISDTKLDEAVNEQTKNGGKLGEVLEKLKLLTNQQVTQSLADYLKVERVALDDLSRIDMDVARKIPENIAKRFCLAAIGQINGQGEVVVAMSDPLNIVAIDTVTLRLKRPVRAVIASVTEIRRAIEVIYHGSDVEEQRLRDLVEIEIDTDDEATAFKDEYGTADISSEADADDAPVIRFVDLLLSQAVKSKASDIHVEPQEKSMTIRMRIDGVLRDMVPPPRKMQSAIIARLKILSEMDIAERRLPQDGRFKLTIDDNEVDFRVSVLPSSRGEKVALRVLDKSLAMLDIEKLGFEKDTLTLLKKCVSHPHGPA